MSCPASTPARYSTLDAWRGFACLLVVISHTTLFLFHTTRPNDSPIGEWLVSVTGRMTVGVPLFFVISGYCIAATADATRARGTGVGRYFARRFRRIYPPYWAALVLVVISAFVLERVIARGFVSGPFGGVVGAIPEPTTVAPQQWLGSVTLTETWRPLVNPSTPEQQILGPAWTLCYEEQFYAITGLLLLITRRWFFAGVLAVTVCVTAGVLLDWGGMPVKGTFLDGRWLMFAAGVGVYWNLTRPVRAARVALVIVLLLGAVYACRNLEVLFSRSHFSRLADGKELLPGCLFAFVLLIAHRWDNWTANCTVGRSLAKVGKYSYSLYLIHYPICLVIAHAAYRAGITGAWQTLLLVTPLGVWLSMRAGEAFYQAIERHFTVTSTSARRTDTAPAHPPQPQPA
jgi:peptidoglycan/LPS O-acetylase OafA/YrhL